MSFTSRTIGSRNKEPHRGDPVREHGLCTAERPRRQLCYAVSSANSVLGEHIYDLSALLR